MSAFQFTILLSQLLCFFADERIILGKHSREERGLDLIGKFSTPGVFYEHFVKPGVPLLWRAVLDEPKVKFPAYNYWTDGYFREKFGDEEYNVEVQKKENRDKKSVKMTLTQFLDEYKIKPIYLIDSLSEKMKEDLSLPSTFQCGGLEKSINDVVMWFSSGGTSSVLHKDPLNNFMCVLEGSKDFVFINKKYEKEVESVGWVEEGSYSTVDVDNVNRRKFSTLLSLPWVRGHANEGDCIFIPFGWYHQIRSNGRRNLAVNYWFTHRWWFNHPDCIKSSKFNLTEPLNKYPIASSNEILRFKMLRPYKDLEYILKDQFLEPDVDKEDREKLFDFINLDRDNVLTWEELYEFDIDEAVLKYHHVLALDYVRTVEDTGPETEEVMKGGEDQGVEIDEGVVLEEYPHGEDHFKRMHQQILKELKMVMKTMIQKTARSRMNCEKYYVCMLEFLPLILKLEDCVEVYESAL
ncbi:hypothetical protein LOTGIDRAFT_157933 [Lottia gigantea]|uniref:JmjC domain-containing protein n=1 Tax=Lottia gigantea TaxID=225164 RepID=V4AZS8_LOTGI|nr:hypothetical protein LOTGIDRAFT_157933 [Lottia gigantea]ESP00651.1 hypothetical protein LOTGIDRAFT_157933 [Lottia gigantea]